jgi:hypothetical protein
LGSSRRAEQSEEKRRKGSLNPGNHSFSKVRLKTGPMCEFYNFSHENYKTFWHNMAQLLQIN